MTVNNCFRLISAFQTPVWSATVCASQRLCAS